MVSSTLGLLSSVELGVVIPSSSSSSSFSLTLSSGYFPNNCFYPMTTLKASFLALKSFPGLNAPSPILNATKATSPLNPVKCLSFPTKMKYLGTVKCLTFSYS